jgi:hypothetical protein
MNAIYKISVNVFLTIEIHEIVYGIDDYVKFRWVIYTYDMTYDPNDADAKFVLSKSKIRYNKKGEAYFITKKRRFYLKNFVKF